MNEKQKEIIAFAKKRGMKTPQWERENTLEEINRNREKMGLEPFKKKEK